MAVKRKKSKVKSAKKARKPAKKAKPKAAKRKPAKKSKAKPAKKATRKRAQDKRKRASKARTVVERGIGAPLKLTRDLIDEICTAVRAGNYIGVACQYVGIGKSTYYRWMKVGALEEGKPAKDRTLFWEFWDRVTRAEAECEVSAVAQFMHHTARDARATSDFLAKRFRERWGVQAVELRRPGEGGTLDLDAIRELLTDEEQVDFDKELAEND